jgi:hypothetical protein
VQLKLTSKQERNNGNGNDGGNWQAQLKTPCFHTMGKSLPLTAAF